MKERSLNKAEAEIVDQLKMMVAFYQTLPERRQRKITYNGLRDFNIRNNMRQKSKEVFKRMLLTKDLNFVHEFNKSIENKVE
ncbi:MAG: hypothetical protein EBY20_01265 [Alphaproteobacteria bacterium]|nr:hypothetical protein [Alphaproteobacteria bacterium]